MKHGEAIDSVCPHCGSDEVGITFHGVFRREGSRLVPEPTLTTLEAICDDCGHSCQDEPAEILLRERYPELFEDGE